MVGVCLLSRYVFIYKPDQQDIVCTFILKGKSYSYEEYLLLFKTLDIDSNYVGYQLVEN